MRSSVKPRDFVLQLVAVAIVLLIAAGMIYEKAGQRRDRRRYPQIGRSVDIGGRTLNIYCSGEGGPTVVFETFGHTAGYSWKAVQAETAKFTRACWYDRADYGWSDPAPMPRTFQAIASDLHALLHNAAERGPYIFVGARDAALEIRVYHAAYHDDVAGVVMINPNEVDNPAIDIPDSAKGGWAKHFGKMAPRVKKVACVAWPAIANIGLLRAATAIQGMRGTPSFGLNAEEQTELDFLSDNPTAQRGGGACAREEDMQQVRAAGNLGDLPLLVLTSPDAFSSPDPRERAVMAAWNQYQSDQAQPAIVRLSSRGRLVLESRDIGLPEIVNAIREMTRN